MDANMQAQEVCLKVLCVLDPRPLIDTWSSGLLQSEEACPQDLNVDVMQERRQLVLSVPGDGFSYAGLRALRPDRALQLRILLGPAPSLHGLRSGRDRFVRSLPRYFGQVRLLHRAHRRLRPPAFPTTSRPRLAGTAMEISRFPCKRLVCMPGSTTTRGRQVSRESDAFHVAFCWSGEHRHPEFGLRRSIPGLLTP